jgi:hypothetical protein
MVDAGYIGGTSILWNIDQNNNSMDGRDVSFRVTDPLQPFESDAVVDAWKRLQVVITRSPQERARFIAYVDETVARVNSGSASGNISITDNVSNGKRKVHEDKSPSPTHTHTHTHTHTRTHTENCDDNAGTGYIQTGFVTTDGYGCKRLKSFANLSQTQ